MPNDGRPPAISSQDIRPPILTLGKLTPALLCAFQMGALQYFSQKNLPTLLINKSLGHLGFHDHTFRIDYINTLHVLTLSVSVTL